MFRLHKSKWHATLKACDHAVASSAIMHYLTEHRPTPELAAALEHYFENPGYRTALPVVAADPNLILLFRESRPGGVFHQFTAPLA